MDIVNASSSSPGAVQNRGGQYLSFMLGSEEYAVDILRVREIRGLCPVTPLPNAPPHVQGVMNLRGTVVPVVDLRQALGLPKAELNKFTVIIVLSVRNRTMGFVVDSVCEVLSLSPSDIETSPDLGTRVDANVVGGIARTEGRFVVLLEPDRIGGSEAALP